MALGDVIVDFPAQESVYFVFLCADREIQARICKGNLTVCTKKLGTRHPCLCLSDYGFQESLCIKKSNSLLAKQCEYFAY